MHADNITPQILVGACPRSSADIDELKAAFRVTAVLNLQTEEDLRYWNIAWPDLEAHYRTTGITVRRTPVRDFDPASLRNNLPYCVHELRALVQAGHTVYVHCNAGINRSPTTIIAYLHWVEQRELGESVWLVTSRHTCDPYVSAVIQATDAWKSGFGAC
jgi:protein-tyrosine phosphatase